jgi:hypothetical protein
MKHSRHHGSLHVTNQNKNPMLFNQHQLPKQRSAAHLHSPQEVLPTTIHLRKLLLKLLVAVLQAGAHVHDSLQRQEGAPAPTQNTA